MLRYIFVSSNMYSRALCPLGRQSAREREARAMAASSNTTDTEGLYEAEESREAGS